ncbi:hypothetical protein INT44_003928 [Umbelopsis vinacea]|uniref:Glutathione S-transferase n=1 Tax=Umbelopsis vinacea TaxID=44442 RepID=A0A8H7Q9B1_9FUNG|nr:hypothetical protein INT44_003928 [Umbelopsis vinacea]
MTLTVVGAKISTFTRTIRLALEHLNIPYELLETFPHEELAYKYNAFGKIPTLTDNDLVVNETLAIRRYIDHISEHNQKSLEPEGIQNLLQVDQWVSVASDYAFRELILTISKPRQAMEGKGQCEADIQANLKKSLDRARVVLRAIEQHLVSGKVQETGWLCGSSITWADLFMFPVFADFASLPERKLMQQESPQLWKWYQRFANTDIAAKTFQGTVADQRKESHQSSL